MSNRRLMLALACLGLTGCETTPTIGGAEGLQVMSNSSLPVPTRADLTAPTTPYYLGPFDKLIIDVLGIPELSEKEVQIDASGRLSFPMVGAIAVAGKSPDEVAAEIAAGLRQHFVRDPRVTVNLKETVSQVVTVEGEVEQPGLYPVVANMTLLRAIATAKGTTEFTKLSNVVVFRTIGNREYAALYDLRAIRKGAYSDPKIYPNDVVMVGESRARRIFRDFLQIAPALSTPLIIAFQR